MRRSRIYRLNPPAPADETPVFPLERTETPVPSRVRRRFAPAEDQEPEAELQRLVYGLPGEGAS